MYTSVQRWQLLDLCDASLHDAMDIHQSKCSRLSLVAAKYFLSLCNMLCHRSRSADLICNVLEIHSNLNKFGKTLAKPSTALLERSCAAKGKAATWKFRVIDVSLSEPDTELLLCKEKLLHHGNLGGIWWINNLMLHVLGSLLCC